MHQIRRSESDPLQEAPRFKTPNIEDERMDPQSLPSLPQIQRLPLQGMEEGNIRIRIVGKVGRHLDRQEELRIKNHSIDRLNRSSCEIDASGSFQSSLQGWPGHDGTA